MRDEPREREPRRGDDTRNRHAEAALGAVRRELPELLAESDWVSLHVNLSPATRKMFGAEAFAQMRPGVCFINCSRGGVVDEDALLEALRSGHLAGVGLDVFDPEPPAADHPLFAFDNVVLTPHRGGQSAEGLIGCSRVVEDVIRVLRGEEPRFGVNEI